MNSLRERKHFVGNFCIESIQEEAKSPLIKLSRFLNRNCNFADECSIRTQPIASAAGTRASKLLANANAYRLFLSRLR